MDPFTVTEMLGLQILQVLPQEQFVFSGIEDYAPGVIGRKKELANRSRETQCLRKLLTDRRVDLRKELQKRSANPSSKHRRPCKTVAPGERLPGQIYYFPGVPG